MLKKSLLITAISIGLIALLGQAITAQGFGKLDRQLWSVVFSNSDESRTSDVLIKMKDQVDLSSFKGIKNINDRHQAMYNSLTQLALQSQADLISMLRTRGSTVRPYYLINMILATKLDAETLKEIIQRDDVEMVSADLDIQMLPELPMVQTTMGLQTTAETNIQFIGAERVWDELGVRGAGITVAGQDTGVEWEHLALNRQYRGQHADGTVDHNYNWMDGISSPIKGGSRCGYNKSAPCDDGDHGSHTMGTIIGDDGGKNKIGVAPDANWIACRNMDAGEGRPHTYLNCFEFFFAPYQLGGDPLKDGRPDLAPNVMNNSWGCPDSEKCQGDILLQALRTLKAAGVFVVVSAGNSGPSCKTIMDTPAWHSQDTFSVGAYDHRNKKIAGFSSRGPSLFDGGIGPDIVAPGVSIRSSITGGRYESMFWSGTSMAGPHVVGVAALMWSAQPKLIGDIDRTADLLIQTATPVPSAGCMDDGQVQVPNNYFGYGIVDAYKAVQAAQQL